jgi:cytochrome c-type biogenesis protein CcmH/NrfG
MKVTRAVAVALMLSGSLWLVAPQSFAAPGDGTIQNQEIGKALKDAKKLADKKQYAPALEAVKKAQAVSGKSPLDEFKINEFLAYIYTQQKRYADAAGVYAAMAASPQVPAAQAPRYLKTTAQLYYQAEQYGKTIEYAEKTLKLTPEATDVRELAGQAAFLTKDFKRAASTMQQLVSQIEKRREKPKESWLQVIWSSYYQLQDRAQTANALEGLLRYYPKAEYWKNILDLKTAGPKPESVQLGYYRLAFDLGLLADAKDYESMALNAVDAGAPQEAVRVLQTGLDNKVLASNAKAESRYRGMLDYAKKAVATNEEKAAKLVADAKTAANGEPSVALGTMYLAQGRYDEAVKAINAGITKGKLEDVDRARVNLGIAYLKQKQVEQARATFGAVPAKSPWYDLAELWTLRAAQ